jgi:ABC-type Fe3+ transport system permease subunit
MAIGRRESRAAGVGLWVLVGVCSGLPLLWLLWQCLTPDVLREVRFTRFHGWLLGRTIGYNAAASAIAMVMAIPGALVIGRGRGRVTTGILLLLPLGLMLPSIAYTYGWMQVLRLFDEALQRPGVVRLLETLRLADDAVRLRAELFVPASPADVARCVWTLACWLWPIPAVVVGLRLRAMDSQVQQQALLDGVYWRFTVRQLLPAAGASLAIVLVLAMQEFAVYERSGISVIATEVRTVFESGLFSGGDPARIVGVTAGADRDPTTQANRAGAAAAVALPMLMLVGVLVAGAYRLLSQWKVEDGVEPESWPSTLETGRRPKVLAVLVMLITVGLPIAATFASIDASRFKPDAEGRGIIAKTWAWASGYTGGTLLYGLLAGVGAIVLGALASVRRSRGLLVLAIAGFLVGGELLAIATIRLYNQPTLRVSGHDLMGWVYNYPPVMVIAYLGRFGWIALLAGNGMWSRTFADLRDIASVDGAGPWRTARSVLWPVAWPTLLAAGLAVAILSMTEVSATVLLSPQRPQSLIPTLMQWVHMLRYDNMLEGSLLLVGIVFGLGLFAVALMRLGRRIVRIVPLLLVVLLTTGE